jgi:hypothetical protein
VTVAYFRSGRRICLVGAFALSATRDAFARRIDAYFAAWRDAVREGAPEQARILQRARRHQRALDRRDGLLGEIAGLS